MALPWAAQVIALPAFRRGVLALIVLNAAVLGLETYPAVDEAAGDALRRVDEVILWLFTAEMALRVAGEGPAGFARDRWHWFDAAVVAAGYLPGGRFLTVARLLRLLRVLRALTVLPNLQRVVAALLRSLPSLGHVTLLLGLLFYVYGTAGTFLYRDLAPARFGSLHASCMTLFQVITLESWVDVMREVTPGAPWSWVFSS